jgi:MFS family permease
MSPTQTMTVEGASAIELETIRLSLAQRNNGLDRASTVSTPAHPPTWSGEEVTTSAKNVKLQLLSCCVCFLVAGLNDGSLGTLLPYLLSTYTISTSFVGIMYATSFAGWFLAAIAMPYVVASAGAKGALLAGAVLYVVSQILRVWVRPSLGLLVYVINNACSYCRLRHLPCLPSRSSFRQLPRHSKMRRPTRSSRRSKRRTCGSGKRSTFGQSDILKSMNRSVIHASYALGLLIAPLLANSIAQQPGRWALYYTVPLGIGVVNVALVLAAFFTRNDFRKLGRGAETEGAQGHETVEAPTDGKTKLQRVAGEMKETLSVKPVWLISLFYFFYLGASFTIGGEQPASSVLSVS